MTTNKNYSTNLNSYDEAAALQQLLQAANDALDAVIERLDNNASDQFADEFTITIAGVQTAFMTAGPQIDALYSFIRHLAGENLYSVDIDGGIVKGGHN